MTWLYKQTSGELDHSGTVVGTGYSGHGPGLNNPAMQQAHDVGPIPQGGYTIGPPRTPIDHLGPLALPLTHVSGNVFGRSEFFIHGDNTAHDHSASDGCIISLTTSASRSSTAAIATSLLSLDPSQLRDALNRQGIGRAQQDPSINASLSMMGFAYARPILRPEEERI
jgi:hypothetical protein